MKTSQHALLSLAISAMLYFFCKSLLMAVAAFVSGVFIDFDHLFEFWREYRKPLDAKLFFSTFRVTAYHKVILVFHSWELLAVGAVVCYLSNWDPVLTGLVIGATHHLITDQLTNTTSKWTYFFLFRMKKNFMTRAIIPGKGI